MKKRIICVVFMLFALVICMGIAASAESSDVKSYDLKLLQEGKFPDLYTDIDALEEFGDYIKTALLNKDDSIEISSSKLTADDAAKLYEDVINHAPKLDYVLGKVNIEESDGRLYIYPKYDNSVSLYATSSVMKEAVNDILAQVKPGMSDVEKVLAVHDYIVLHYQYDLTYSIYYAKEFFENKRGVCNAYTLAIGYIMDELGIPWDFVTSSSMNHAWNMVKLDNKWYHIDATWDDPISDKCGKCRHAYFLLSDDAISDDTHRHFGWDSKYSATSTRYDDFFWNDINSNIQYYNGEWYGVKNEWSDEPGIFKYNFSDNTETIVHSIELLFSEYTNAIGIYNDCLYFATDNSFSTTKSSLYIAPMDDINNFALISNLNIDNDGKNLNGFYFENGQLIYALADDEFYSASSKDYYKYRYFYTKNLRNYKYNDYTIDWTYDNGVLTLNSNAGIITSAGEWSEHADEITSVVINKGVSGIYNQSFKDFSKMKNIQIPNTVKTIGDSAFNRCGSLEYIEIPDTVKSIGDSAFEQCGSLEYIEIPDTVKTIGDYAFCNCQSLKSVEIPNSVTKIGTSSFSHCTALECVEIPSGVKEISDRAFYNCTGLTDVYYSGTEAEWAAVTIGENNSSLADATIHFGSTMPAPRITDATITQTSKGYKLNASLDDTYYGSSLIVVLYNNNLMSAVAEKRINFGDTSAEVELPDCNADSAKVFIWDSLKGMKPLCTAIPIDSGGFIIK